MTEKEKMLAGQLYDPSDPELAALREKARVLSKRYNDAPEPRERERILRQLLPNAHETAFLNGPLQFDYGCFTSFGENAFVNYNFTCLDCAPVKIGANVFMGPNISLLTPVHPMRWQDRNPYRKADGTMTDKEYARPITIEDNCWIGGNVTVCGGFTTFNLMALRFGIAFFCLLPFVRKSVKQLRRAALLRGGILGTVFFAIIAIELQGLRMTDSSAMVSFLENTAIVLVPLGEALLHRRMPEGKSLLCAALALAGVGFLLLRGGRFAITAGVLVCMGTALLYTCYIIMTDRLSHQDDPLLLGAIAIGMVGALSTAASFLFEAPRLPESVRRIRIRKCA